MSGPASIAILGAGAVGGTLGLGWAAAGRKVIFASRDPSAAKIRDLVARAGPNASAATADEAAAEAEAALLALPWSAVEAALPPLAGALAGKTLIDATNPLGMVAGELGLVISGETSGGERVAALAPQARVVKAFNTTGWGNMADPVIDGRATVMFHCADDAPAHDDAEALIVDIGFEPVNAGPLRNARLTEAHAMLWIDLAMKREQGRDIAFALLRR